MPSFYSRLTRGTSTGPTLPAYSAQSQDDELDAAFSDPTPSAAAHSRGAWEMDRLVFSLEDEDGVGQGGDRTERASLAEGTSSRLPAAVPGGYNFDRDPAEEAVAAVAAAHEVRRRTLRDRLLPSRYARVATTDTVDTEALTLPHAGDPTPGTPLTASGRRIGGGNQNDGVFANLSAKPDGRLRPNDDGTLEYVGGDDDGPHKEGEVLPTYDTAALDSAPPYWETTVTLPVGTYGVLGPDDVLVEGLPVGNLFGFAWNLLVSMSFQFVGFLLTYLLHTTHAAKNGSRAGLGITLIQYGLYLRSRSAELASLTPEDLQRQLLNSTSSPDGHGPVPGNNADPWELYGKPGRDWDGSTPGLPGNGTSMYEGMVTAEQLHMSSVANQWLSYVLMVVGWFLLLGGMLNYWRAVRWARAVRGEVAAGGTAV